jgi:hypothetical protein
MCCTFCGHSLRVNGEADTESRDKIAVTLSLDLAPRKDDEDGSGVP